MYIKLGKIDLNYTTKIDDFNIFAEVVDSQLSFENPVLVRNANELDIWFGKNFSSRSYFEELLASGVTLYLYKPIETLGDGSEWIDYNNYHEINLSISQHGITQHLAEELEKIKNDPACEIIVDGTWYRWNGSEFVSENGGNGYDMISFTTTDLEELEILKTENDITIKNAEYEDYPWVWVENEFIPAIELPQNLDNMSASLSNRDTLSIAVPGTDLVYGYPNYRTGQELYSKDYPVSFDLGDRDKNTYRERIRKGLDTQAYTFTYEESDWSGYLVVKRPQTGSNVLITSGEDIELESKEIIYAGNFNQVLDILREIGYIVEDNTIYAPTLQAVTYFYTIPGLTMEPSREITEGLIYKSLSESVGIEFWSRTIGKDPDPYDTDNSEIKVIIEKSDKKNYRITISRYSYTEIFEGPCVVTEIGDERIDHKINNGSKLVRCNILGTNPELKTGTFTMWGARGESQRKDMYWKSLSVMLNDQVESVYPDYFFIPNKSNWISEVEPLDTTYYKEYEKFLSYAKTFNCQFLIQNEWSDYRLEVMHTNDPETFNNPDTSTWDTETLYRVELYIENVITGLEELAGTRYYLKGPIEVTDIRVCKIAESGGDFIYNYVGDSDNRLVYFFGGIMLPEEEQRPGYYVYINGLLTNIFSMSINRVLYGIPVNNPYPTREKLELDLEEYKSNYLVSNNQTYYYKKYQSGDNSNTTAWMRFAIGKVFREIQKNRWSYLGEKDMGRIISNITGVLQRIPSAYGIVSDVKTTDYYFEASQNLLRLSLNLTVDDLIDNNISLNITINYNDNQ